MALVNHLSVEVPTETTEGCGGLEHWHTGSMTRRVPVLHKAVPESCVEVNPEDAKRLGVVNGSKVKITYAPSAVELMITCGMVGLGMFVITVLLKPALIIEKRFEQGQAS